MHSLAARHPWRLDIPLLLSISLLLLAQGLTTPAMEVRVLLVWRDEYSILSNIKFLYLHGRRPAAVALAACSVAYPAGKILALLFFWLAPFSRPWRRRIIHGLRLLGRWSLLDVLAITVFVTGSRVMGIFLDARPLPGIYIYAAAIFVLMIATVLTDRLAHHGR